MNAFKISEKHKKVFHLIGLLLIELAYFSFIFLGYAIFSMLFFGEGGNSFMYSKANGAIFLILLIFSPSVFNIYFYRKSRKTEKQDNFLIVQVALLVVFFFFWHISGWDFYF